MSMPSLFTRTACCAPADGAATSADRRASAARRRRRLANARPLLGRDRLPEVRHALDAVLERFGALGRQRLRVVQRALDVVLPDLAREVVDELHAVAVGIVDVETVRH